MPKSAALREHSRSEVFLARPVPFTQEDPIGLAGGMNLYGYGDGDPINNADPFGLCANPLAAGLGNLKCALEDALTGAKQAVRDAIKTARESVLYLRAGAGMANTSFEVDGNGNAGAILGGAVGSNAVGAGIGIRRDLHEAPEGSIPITTRVGPRIGPARVSATQTTAVNPSTGETTVVSRGVEISVGAGGRLPGAPGSVSVGSPVRFCTGSRCPGTPSP